MKLITIFFLLLLLPFQIFSQESSEEHRIDIQLEECLNDERTQTTVDIMLCIDNALNEWDKELNIVYQKLMNVLTDDQKIALREAQKEWIKFRDREFDNIDSIYNLDGTMWGQVRLMEKLDVVKNRTLALAKYLKNLEN